VAHADELLRRLFSLFVPHHPLDTGHRRQLCYVNPGIAALLGWLILDEVLGTAQVAGMAVILVAVALVTGYGGRLWHLRQR